MRPIETMKRFALLLLLPPLCARAEVVFEESFPVKPAGAVHGTVFTGQPGPRPTAYLDFDQANTAVEIGAAGGYLAYPDSGEGSPLDFRLGQTVTLEAWVRLDSIGEDQNLYIVGKGRTGRPGFLAENQNYALRMRGNQGLACVSFLFRSAANDAQPGDFHRWTSDHGIKPGDAWHHVAVSFTFGQPKSIRGWINGQPVGGAWDMGGASAAAPVSDDDELWIGSALGGKSGNSFKGGIDEVRIHRGPVDEAALTARYQAAKPVKPLRAGALPAEPAAVKGPPKLVEPVRRVDGVVSVELFASVGENKAFPTTLPSPAWSATRSDFLLVNLPQAYDDWGIRADWPGSVLVRQAARVALPAGNHEFLLRGRGGTRLWLGDRVIAQTPFLKGSTDGHEPVPDLPPPPSAGGQPRGYGDKETIVKVDVPAGTHTLVLETLVGSPKLRMESGETLAAIRLAGQPHFHLLGPDARSGVALLSRDWPEILRGEETRAKRENDERRRHLAASRDAYWAKRRAAAADWLATLTPPPDFGGTHPVDFFIEAKLAKARSAKTGAFSGTTFGELQDVHALLQDQCFRCHGEKEKGGLRLNTRELALTGGESGTALSLTDPAKSLLLDRVLRPTDDEERMPPKGDRLSPSQTSLLQRWIAAGAPYPAAAETDIPTPTPLTDGVTFLRRAMLDTLGSFALKTTAGPDTPDMLHLVTSNDATSRARVVDVLLANERWADHWISYWQDVLAENPNFVKPSLNNSGPFRGFLEDALRDNKPVDRWVTELVMLRGSVHGGGSAGFGMAAENDAPLAHKGTILGSAFLGAEMKCARCHDSPYHTTTQKDLFSLAAMLERKDVTVPKSSTVPAAFFEKTKGRESLIKVTLPPGRPVPPEWPFAKLVDPAVAAPLVENPDDPRERLAALLTAPQNTRFARLMVNRVWKRLMGTGLVEPADDWDGADPSHPELLDWLAREFVSHDHDLKHVQRLIMTSDAYARQAVADANPRDPAARFFHAPDKRRLTAEQVVDSLVDVTGIDLRAEVLSFDPEALRPADTQNNLGTPRRAWQFTSLSNERDRPSLAMPRNQAVITVLELFGWRQNRAEPLTCREESVNVLQPATLANGVFGTWVTRLSESHAFTQVCLEASSPSDLADELVLRLLGRTPTDTERDALVKTMEPGFAGRILPAAEIRPTESPPPLKITSWSNHLSEEANRIKLEEEARARAGDAPTPRLRPDWRERAEDVIWALVNAPELVWVP